MLRAEECIIRLHEKFAALEDSVRKNCDGETYVQEQYENFRELLEETKRTAEEYSAAKTKQMAQNTAKLQEICRQIEDCQSKPEEQRQEKISELEEACKKISAEQAEIADIKEQSEKALNEMEKSLQQIVDEMSEIIRTREKTKEIIQESNDLVLTENQLIAQREIMKNELKRIKKAKHKKR